MYRGKIKVKIFTDSNHNFAISIEIRKISINCDELKEGKEDGRL